MLLPQDGSGLLSVFTKNLGVKSMSRFLKSVLPFPTAASQPLSCRTERLARDIIRDMGGHHIVALCTLLSLLSECNPKMVKVVSDISVFIVPRAFATRNMAAALRIVFIVPGSVDCFMLNYLFYAIGMRSNFIGCHGSVRLGNSLFGQERGRSFGESTNRR
ncbi:hypothetical protein XENOCAPTIV_002380 [Xenoophorus captivus]|uniref:Uncharacterized protein n=1 Tax=Xenoophorus captivus TaxID=1517983 RepID=A0ABV0SCR1_9TELE